MNLLVDADSVEEWDKYVGATGTYQTRSQLIRTAVQREVARLSGGESLSSSSESEARGEMTTAIQSLEQTIESMDEKLDRLRDEVDTSAEVDLNKILLQVIPEPEELSHPQSGLTAGEITNRVGGDPDTIADNLKDLAESNPRIHRKEEQVQHHDQGTVRQAVYYKESRDYEGN